MRVLKWSNLLLIFHWLDFRVLLLLRPLAVMYWAPLVCVPGEKSVDVPMPRTCSTSWAFPQMHFGLSFTNKGCSRDIGCLI